MQLSEVPQSGRDHWMPCPNRPAWLLVASSLPGAVRKTRRSELAAILLPLPAVHECLVSVVGRVANGKPGTHTHSKAELKRGPLCIYNKQYVTGEKKNQKLPTFHAHLSAACPRPRERTLVGDEGEDALENVSATSAPLTVMSSPSCISSSLSRVSSPSLPSSKSSSSSFSCMSSNSKTTWHGNTYKKQPFHSKHSFPQKLHLYTHTHTCSQQPLNLFIKWRHLVTIIAAGMRCEGT